MKKSMIIGKRQIVLAVLILVLGVAVYLNWRYASDGNTDLTAALSSQKNMGDAQYVNTQESDVSDENADENNTENSDAAETTMGNKYDFDNARTERQQSRTDALNILTDLMNNTQTNEESKKKAAEDVSQLAKNVEIENSVETLVKAKGFSECIAIISNESINVVVKKDGDLEQTEMLQIQDIVVSETGMDLDNIKIVSVN